jgi:hypothetical protein
MSMDRPGQRYRSLQTTTNLQQVEFDQSAIISSWDSSQGSHRVRKIPACEILLLIFGTCCASATGFAENALGFYFGAGVGESEGKRDRYHESFFDEHHFTWKAIAGTRPISPVGVELEYIDFSNPSAGPNYNFRSANSDAKVCYA